MSSLLEQGDFDFGPAASLVNGVLNGTYAGTNNSAQFQDAVEEILLKNVKTHRVTLLILSAFSLFAALIVILVVFSDARTVQRERLSPKSGCRPSLWAAIHTAEVMPLAVAVASIIQSCAIIGVQSQTLDTFWATGCTLTAQLVWPMIWIVAFTVTAFSLESSFRSLRSARFGPRGKVHLLASVVLIILLLLATFITAHVLPSRDICWGSLVWWAIHFVQPSIALAGGIILVNIVTGIVMVTQLMKTAEMCRDERIAASRVVYSLAINISIMAILLPFFILFIISKMNKEASFMADIIVTLNGLVHGVIHLFLRTNSEPTAIRPSNIPWIKNRPLRIFGPNDLNHHTFISTPLISDREIGRAMQYPQQQYPISEKKPSIGEESYSSLPRQQYISIHPDVAPIPPVAQADASHKSRAASTYSIFPADRSNTRKNSQINTSVPPLPQMFFSPKSNSTSQPRSSVKSMMTRFSHDSATLSKALRPPQPSFASHRRSDSAATSEIVEIGFRFSNGPIEKDLPTPQKPSPAVQSEPLAPEPALLSPDRYVPAARYAEIAKSRPTTPGAPEKIVDALEIKKLVEPPRIIGLPTGPSANKRTRQKSFRDSITGRLTGTKRPVADKFAEKSLPPVPVEEQSQESAALEALRHSTSSLAVAPLKQAVPNWRQPVTRTGVSPTSTDRKSNSWKAERKSKPPAEGWI